MSAAETQRWVKSWECYKDPNWWVLASYIVSFIIGVLNIIIFSRSFKILCSNRKSQKLDTFIKKIHVSVLYLTINFLYTLGPIVFIVQAVFSLSCTFNNNFGRKMHDSLAIVAVHSIILSAILLYLFFVGRVIELSLNKYLSILLLSGFIMQLIALIITVNYYFQIFSVMNTDILEKALMWSYITLYLNLGFSIILLSIFIAKIHQLSDQLSIKAKNRALYFSIRYLLLALIALMSTNLMNLTNVYRRKNAPLDMRIMMSKNILVVIDSSVNMICLYLQFSFADKLYNVLCKCCYTKCIKMFVKSDNVELIPTISHKTNATGKSIEMCDPNETTLETTTCTTTIGNSDDLPGLHLQKDISKFDMHPSESFNLNYNHL